MVKKESNHPRKKTTDEMNDEIKPLYNHITSEKTGQPVPQPKDYDEIEY
jgi:hypothetical protein